MFNFNDMPPDEWIYKETLNIKTPFDGRRIKVKSIFTNEKSASMFLYYREGKYYFKDFSSGLHGDALQFTKELIKHSLNQDFSLPEVTKYLKDLYKEWRGKNGTYVTSKVDEYYTDTKFTVNMRTRPLNHTDLNYWSGYNISEELLKRYNVRALKWFSMGKINMKLNCVEWGSNFELNHSYGIFNDKNQLLKIYNPFNEVYKHITVQPAVMGLEQLNNHMTCIICSSMKDALCLKSSGLNIDVIWPSSEKTIISKEVIDDLKNMYPALFTMFDNDETGIKAMCMYKTLYNIDFIYIPQYKDVADKSNRELANQFKLSMAKIINKKLEQCTTTMPV